MTKSENIYIIAEAGVNHNGNKKVALEMVDKAVAAGADAIKFQTFKTELLVTSYAEKSAYQKQDNSKKIDQYSMLKQLELSQKDFREIKQYCSTKNIDFLSTAFDFESLCFLTDELNLSTLKIPSGDLTNAPLLLEHSLRAKKMIVSTGMSSIEDIKYALGIIAFGMLEIKGKPSLKKFQHAYKSKMGQQILKNNVTILHCTSSYPAPFDEINLNAIKTLKQTLNLNIGYSDHSVGITVPIVAASLGAKIIEKHFTLNKTLKGPDHKASLEPKELKNMIDKIRLVERILGTEALGITTSEYENFVSAKKSIVASKSIKKGEQFLYENLTCKRPGNGMSPLKFWNLLGKKSKINYKKNDQIIE
jgi:N-acetylneuraminate synthase